MTYTQPSGNGICVGTHHHEPERPRKAAEGGHLCPGCTDRLDRALDAIPNLVDDLERALIPGGSSRGPMVTGSRETPMPYNTAAGDARRALLDVLGSWTRLIAEARGEHLPSDLSPKGQAEWQGYRLTVWTVAQEWISEYASNLGGAVAEGRRVLRGAKTRTLILGACTGADRCDVETHEHLPCPGEIKARIDLLDEQLPDGVECSSCGHTHTTRKLLTLGKQLEKTRTVWLTNAEVAALLRVKESTVRAYASREGWRRRDHENIRPSRWHSDDVNAHITRAQQEAS